MGIFNMVFCIKVTAFSNFKIEYFMEWKSMAFVLGGTFLALVLSFPLKVLIQSFSVIKVLLSKERNSIENIRNTLYTLAEQARKKGILSLESEINTLEDSFFKKAIMLLVDGHSKDKVEYILKNDIHQMNKRHEQIIGIFDRAMNYTIAFGLFGTLIQVILTLREISMIGDGVNTMMIQMSMALLPTLYGGILTYLWYTPIVNKLIVKHEKEVLFKEMIYDGVMAIQLGSSPKQIKEQLDSYLAEKKRVYH